MNENWRIAVETSGRKGSAAIGRGSLMLAERPFATDTEHARDLLPVIERLFADSGAQERHIEHCYVSIGPGSFTGLRVAVTFARHLSLAHGTKLVGVPTLDVIARNALELKEPPRRLVVILDAKRKQVFGAVYEIKKAGGYEQIISPCLIEPETLFQQAGKPLAIMGEGIAYHLDAVRNAGVEVLDEGLWFPRASSVYTIGSGMAEQGLFTTAEDLVPFYLRRPEAEEVWEKRHGSLGQ